MIVADASLVALLVVPGESSALAEALQHAAILKAFPGIAVHPARLLTGP